MVSRLAPCALVLSLILASVAWPLNAAEPPDEALLANEELVLEDAVLSSCAPDTACDSCVEDSCGGSRLGLGEVLVDTLLLDIWLEQGFTWNPDNPANRFNLPVTFNDRSNEYQMDQLYLSLGRRVRPTGCEWDFGGRVDLLYGTDYFFTESFGLERQRNGSPRWNSSVGPRSTGAALFGLALPQLYAELFAPLGNGLTVRLGHFYTILGCESVRAPDNFFYSHSYVMQYGEPKTHTGMLAAYNLSKHLTLQAGLTRGWDAWDGPNDKLKFLGGLSWASCDKKTTLAFAIHSGNEDASGDYNRTSYSLVWMRCLGRRLRYIFQHDLGVEEHAEVDQRGNPSDAKWYGINQYLLYDLNCKTSLGLRFEWFRDQDNARVLALPNESLVNGGNYWAITFGLNWRPTSHVTVRPECRWDWSDVSVPGLANGMYDDFSDKNQFTLGTDVIVQF